MARAGSSTRGEPKRRRSSDALEAVLRGIPGYDPFATAGDCTLDLKAARRAIAFFHECLTFTAGQWMGRPFVLQPWQQAIVGNLFGWKRPDGTRRYREVLIYVPRKSGKSELAGGLGCLLARLEAWDACGREAGDEDGVGAVVAAGIDPASLEGRECFAGLDLSTTTDLSALVLLFRPPAGGHGDDDGTVTVLPYFWIPADNAEKRERRDRVPYLTWARQGLIEMTPGNVIDYDVIRTRVNALHERFIIREVAIDPWNATQLSLQLQGDRLSVVTFGQGYREMTAPAKEFEKLVLSGKLRHGGHPVLRWMASHVAAETDAAGNLKPSKKKSSDRIDGIVAAVMALGRALVNVEPASVYDTRGILYI